MGRMQGTVGIGKALEGNPFQFARCLMIRWSHDDKVKWCSPAISLLYEGCIAVNIGIFVDYG